MIPVGDILTLHDFSIKDFGGSAGVRDKGLLESAIARPFQTFGGEDLYESPITKAAALAESLIVNHPFVDGNKRTGMLAMVSLLLEYKIKIIADKDNLYRFIISISTGEIKFDQIVEWLTKNTIAI